MGEKEERRGEERRGEERRGKERRKDMKLYCSHSPGRTVCGVGAPSLTSKVADTGGELQ